MGLIRLHPARENVDYVVNVLHLSFNQQVQVW